MSADRPSKPWPLATRMAPFNRRIATRSILMCSLAFVFTVFLFFQLYNHQSGIASFGQPWRHSRPLRHGKPHEIDITQVPKKLWYKHGAKGLNRKTRQWTKTCISKNPDYEVILMDDAAADRYIEETYGVLHRNIVNLYMSLTIPILKADMFRIMVLYAEGGVYLDLDVHCNYPFDEWIPPAIKNGPTPPSVVMGWEYDYGRDEYYVANPQLASWAIMAAPNSVHMWAVIQDTYDALWEMTRANNLASPADLTMDIINDVVAATGPARITKAALYGTVRKQLLQTMNESEVEGEYRKIRRIMEPVLISDFLVMPGAAWARGTQHFEEWTEKGGKIPDELATHHYAGSWKNDHGGD